VAGISVIISTLDRPKQLARCLDALLSGSSLPAEIVVVDQGDPHRTADILEARRSAAVTLVHVVQERRGLSASQNAGVERASCPVVSIVDDDCVPDARWVQVAAREHAATSGPLLLGGRVLALPAAGDRTIPLSLRTSTQRKTMRPDAMPWNLGTGGNFSVTRSAYLEVGGNNELLGTGTPGRAGNDLDLFHRLMRAGVQARFEPDLVVQHERATSDEARARGFTYGFGIGACVAAWVASGDASAWRVLAAWFVMRARMLVRRPRTIRDEGRVIFGTFRGLWYGSRVAHAAPPSGRAT
jgi:GT2 family glycosyltransferase